ncbi:hypothetical protein FRB99_001084 [Tulasnella sp. 403]|nr:hypothetical protein FRB99_001084 [Tulasnella sp. 403]
MTSSPTDYVVIDTVDGLVDTLDALYAVHTSPTDVPRLYVDLEGYDLCRHGRISLLAIHAEPLQKTFLIDVHVLGPLSFITPGVDAGKGKDLKMLLQDPEIPKVLFDCRNDSDALYNLYQVDMAGVEDLQLMELATRRGRRSLVNGLAKTIVDYAELDEEQLKQWKETKEEGKRRMNDDDGTVFEQRPLEPIVIQYAVQDVSLLPRLWVLFNGKLNKNWRSKVDEEVYWRLQLARQDEYYVITARVGRNADAMVLSPWSRGKEDRKKRNYF